METVFPFGTGLEYSQAFVYEHQAGSVQRETGRPWRLTKEWPVLEQATIS